MLMLHTGTCILHPITGLLGILPRAEAKHIRCLKHHERTVEL